MNLIDNIIYFSRLLKSNVTGASIPLTLTLSITGNCNFSCGYCYGDYNKEKSAADLTTDEWFSLIHEAANMGTKSIQLLGGEPLLRDDIDAIVDRIKSHRMICSMNTNGSLIKKYIETIKKLDNLTVSLDGRAEANDKTNIQKLLHALRGVPGPERGAHFYCAMVFVRHAEDPAPLISFGKWPGIIMEQPRGEGGFGYDPVFWVPGEDCSSAELPPEVKNSISHRGQALTALIAQMKDEFRS